MVEKAEAEEEEEVRRLVKLSRKVNDGWPEGKGWREVIFLYPSSCGGESLN